MLHVPFNPFKSIQIHLKGRIAELERKVLCFLYPFFSTTLTKSTQNISHTHSIKNPPQFTTKCNKIVPLQHLQPILYVYLHNTQWMWGKNVENESSEPFGEKNFRSIINLFQSQPLRNGLPFSLFAKTNTNLHKNHILCHNRLPFHQFLL